MSEALSTHSTPAGFSLEQVFNLAKRQTIEELQNRLTWFCSLYRRRYEMHLTQSQLQNLTRAIEVVRHWLTVRLLEKYLKEQGQSLKVASVSLPQMYAHLN